jgi:CHAT domain-containing protein
MYSAPLIRSKKKMPPKPLSDPVQFETEIDALRRMFQEENYKIKLKVGIATVNNLINVISKQPTILHFICHGEYSKKKQKAYLVFENDCGELDKCYSDTIEKLLSKTNCDIKIVFVNACHSEEVGKIFLEAGIPCVIAVQSELKIEDGVAQKFSENFYRSIFGGETIKKAFEQATTQVQALYRNNVYTCCCAHKHTTNCGW